MFCSSSNPSNNGAPLPNEYATNTNVNYGIKQKTVISTQQLSYPGLDTIHLSITWHDCKYRGHKHGHPWAFRCPDVNSSDAMWRHRTWSNIGSGNGLLSDGTKPLPVPISTYQSSKMFKSIHHALRWEQFKKKCHALTKSVCICVHRLPVYNYDRIFQGPISYYRWAPLTMNRHKKYVIILLFWIHFHRSNKI